MGVMAAICPLSTSEVSGRGLMLEHHRCVHSQRCHWDFGKRGHENPLPEEERIHTHAPHALKIPIGNQAPAIVLSLAAHQSLGV